MNINLLWLELIFVPIALILGIVIGFMYKQNQV